MSDNRISPREVMLLMHIYALPGLPMGRYDDLISDWLGEGIISSRLGVDGYYTTDKGNKWVDMICSTPKPISLWADPRDKA